MVPRETDQRGWRALARCDDPGEAHVLATSVEAMEFDVRVRDARTGLPVVGITADALPKGPLVVDVRDRDWSDLFDLVEEIVDEQTQFDALLADRDARIAHLRGIVLRVIVFVVVVLALLGLIEL